MLAQWALIEADLDQFHRIDIESDLLDRRSARWLRTRIAGLLVIESRLQGHFARKYRAKPKQ